MVREGPDMPGFFLAAVVGLIFTCSKPRIPSSILIKEIRRRPTVAICAGRFKWSNEERSHALAFEEMF